MVDEGVRPPVPDALTSEHRLIFYRLVRLEQAARAGAAQRDAFAVRSVWPGRSPNSD